MLIREAVLDDLISIGEIAKASFDDYSESDFHDSIINPNYLFFVAQDESKVIGFVSFLRVDDKLEIIKIATDEKHRGKGIATALLLKMEEWGRANNKIGIILEVNEKNLKARRLYDKVGYKTIHVRKKYYKATDDAFIMEKIF